MKHALKLLFSVLFPFITGTVSGAEISLPGVYNDLPRNQLALRTKASSDGSVVVIAAEARVREGVSPYVFFDETLWKRQVDVSKFMPQRPPTAKLEFASFFCAMNQEVAAQACAQGFELTGVDTSKAWWIPIAVVPREEEGAVKAQLMLPPQAQQMTRDTVPPVPETQVREPATPAEQPAQQPVQYTMPQQVPVRNRIMWDDPPAQKQSTQTIRWDD